MTIWRNWAGIWPQGSRGLALWLCPLPSTPLPRPHPGDVAWHPESLCPLPSSDSPCSAPQPADLGCRQEAGTRSCLRDIVQLEGMLCHGIGWPDEQRFRMGGRDPKDRWETEACGDQWRQQDLPEGLPSPAGLPARPGLLLSWGRNGWEEGGTAFQRRM